MSAETRDAERALDVRKLLRDERGIPLKPSKDAIRQVDWPRARHWRG